MKKIYGKPVAAKSAALLQKAAAQAVSGGEVIIIPAPQ